MESTQRCLEIVRVLHGSMNFKLHLPPFLRRPLSAKDRTVKYQRPGLYQTRKCFIAPWLRSCCVRPGPRHLPDDPDQTPPERWRMTMREDSKMSFDYRVD